MPVNETSKEPQNIFVTPATSKMSTIDQGLQLKWGLFLLGKEKARQYLEWVQRRTGIIIIEDEKGGK